MSSSKLTGEEIRYLVAVYKENPNLQFRNILIKLNLDLARLAAHDFRKANPHIEYKDLEQEAMLALVKVIDMFRLDGGASFSNYAITYIRGALQHYIRDKSNMVRLPQKVLRLHQQIHAPVNRKLSISELAERLQCSQEEVQEAYKLKRTTSYSNSEEIPIEPIEQTAQPVDLLPVQKIKELINRGLKHKELWDAINAIT
jgi:RNA polymerase sigma-B factor